MIAPNPFRGYEHEFSPRKTLAVPTINALFYWLNQRLFLWCADRYAARLIVTAKFSLNRLKRRFGDRLSIVPYGLGPPKAEIGTTKDFDVIFVGRFHPQKGLFFLLKAWREVVAKRPGAKLAIIGTGTESIEKDLRAAIKTMQLTDSISLLGFLSGYAKDQVVARSRVFAFPSTYESFGIVALEAMQLGVPVVGFDLPVYDGVFDAMVKVPFGSTHAMAEEILALLTDAKRYAAVSRAAKENAQRFSWDSSAVLYSEILAAAAQSSK
jgi:glycosyltransferase involved in cell wall biosynthesis